jgi:hypothetical protein
MKEQQEDIQALMSDALVYLHANEPALAEESYASALEASETNFGEDHPMTLKCLECLARVCALQESDVGPDRDGSYDKTKFAIQLFEKVVSVRDLSAATADVGEMANVLAELGACYTKVGMLDEATMMESRAEKAFEVMKEKYGQAPEDKDEEEDEDEDDTPQNMSREAWEEKNEDVKEEEETKGGERWKI